MAMTEDEAKTKWCPFAHTAVSMAKYVISANGTVDYEDHAYIPHPGCMCLASGCMAWDGSSTTKDFAALPGTTTDDD